MNRLVLAVLVSAVVAAAPQAGAQANGYGRVDLKADAGGQFTAEIEIEGQRVSMLVDTGEVSTGRPGRPATIYRRISRDPRSTQPHRHERR